MQLRIYSYISDRGAKTSCAERVINSERESVCVYGVTHTHIYIYIYTHTHVYIYI